MGTYSWNLNGAAPQRACCWRRFVELDIRRSLYGPKPYLRPTMPTAVPLMLEGQSNTIVLFMA